MDDKENLDIVAPSAGVHIILPNYYSPRNMGLLDPATSDGRVIFFLPWEGSTIAGTTGKLFIFVIYIRIIHVSTFSLSLLDSPTEVTPNPMPKEDEVKWILDEVSHYLNQGKLTYRGKEGCILIFYM